MPIALEQPETGGDIEIYSGDPFTLVLKIAGEDRTSHSFTADVRRRPQEQDVITSFTVSAVLVNGDTVVTLALSGDSGEGVLDGQTRLIERTASFDVQEWDQFGMAVQTIATGQLKRVEDVTR